MQKPITMSERMIWMPKQTSDAKNLASSRSGFFGSLLSRFLSLFHRFFCKVFPAFTECGHYQMVHDYFDFFWFEFADNIPVVDSEEARYG